MANPDNRDTYLKPAEYDTVAVVLAAGFSKRFGSDKRLHPISTQVNNDATRMPMLQVTLERLLPLFRQVLVVHRFKDEDILALLEHYPLHKVAAPETPVGLGVSLATAAKYLIGAENKIRQLMVFLGDMPSIRAHTIRQIIVEADAHPMAIIRPRFDGKSGHPVCFPANFLEPLSQLNQDQGAAQLIKTSGNRVHFVDVEDPGVLFDIDHLEQIAPPGDDGQ
ncbi:nucleotidyltransferase family protein [Thalassotalea mangrovi]|nr:nucleotidyltransferase family protein [Thalassotalea mangrovi]